MTTPQTPAPTGLAPKGDSALAAIPPELEGAIQPDEWAQMTPDQRAGVLAFFRDEQQQTTDGLSITFPRIKYPTSGSPFWAVPGIGGEVQPTREIEGIVVFKQPVRAYWPLADAVGKNPPTCSSLDGIKPIDVEGKQAATCASCPQAGWGTGKEGRGQACKSRLNVFVLRDGQDIPTLISLPPTALKTFADFAVALRQARSALVAVTTVFGLREETSGGGVKYQALTLKIGRKVSLTEMQLGAKIREIFQDQMQRRGVQTDEVDDGHDAPAGAGDATVIDTTGRTIA